MQKFFLRVTHFPQGLAQAVRELQQGVHRHDVLERAVRALEQDPADDQIGFGGFPNVLGEMQLDASFMDGDTRRLGAVAGVKRFLPVRIARKLMEEPQFHTLLHGEGAEMFAREKGLEPEPVLSDAQRDKWQREVKPLLNEYGPARLAELVRKLAAPRPKENRDTTIMIASDGQGLAGAASTSGWAYKYPGRAGDTPVAGAGLYVDSRYGGCACTYTGEIATRGGSARYAVARMAEGDTPEKAVRAAAEDLKSLSGGALRTLVIHAINRNGDAHVAAINAQEPIKFQYWREGMSAHECRTAEDVKIKWG